MPLMKPWPSLALLVPWSNLQSPTTSPLTHFTSAGYNCVFAVTWLFSTAQQDQTRNYHDEKAEIVGDFIGDVMAYMGQQGQKAVDIGDSMGPTDCWVGRVGLYQSLEQVRNEILFLDSQGGLFTLVSLHTSKCLQTCLGFQHVSQLAQRMQHFRPVALRMCLATTYLGSTQETPP